MKVKIMMGGIGLIMMLMLCLLLFIGCKTFKPVMLPCQPDECNDFYTTMSFYSSMRKAGDSAFVGTVYNECKRAREERRALARQDHCKQLWFGDDPLSRNDSRYISYLECTK